MTIESTYQGRLLVASPILTDDNFSQSVVYMCAHDERGALGVVLNKPHQVEVEEVMPRWAALMATPTRLFHGGPVDEESAICLAWVRDEKEQPGKLSVVSSPVAMLDLEQEPADAASVVSTARIFLGYSGWSKGQLESELAQDAWIPAKADPTDVFTTAPDKLWRNVLRRQENSSAMYSTFIFDAERN